MVNSTRSKPSSNMAIILNPSLGNLELCKDRLENSEVVAIPTETLFTDLPLML